MKSKVSTLAAVGILLLSLACDSDSPTFEDLSLEAADIIGFDATRWICGGAWQLKVESDTFLVHHLPNEQLNVLLESNQHDFTQNSISVWVAFSDQPESSCAQSYEHIRELNQINLR